MDSLGQKTNLTIRDGSISIGGTDLSGSVERLALEIAPDGCWMSFQLRAEVDEVDFDFPVEAVRQFLGGGSAIEASAADLEQVIIAGSGYGSGENAAGQAVYDWLKQHGIVE